MKKTRILILLAILIASPAWGEGTAPQPPSTMVSPLPSETKSMDLRYVNLPPDNLQRVRLSSTDVNRIVCNVGEIKDVVHSREKGLIIKVSGNSVFLKFQVFEGQQQLTYSTNPAEIYLTCGGAVYSMIAEPMRIPSVTVNLADVKDTFKENAVLFKGLALEEKLSKLIKFAYTDEIPASFDVKTPAELGDTSPTEKLPALDIHLMRVVRVGGEGLLLKEYIVYADRDLEVRELDFMSFVERPAAVALDSTTMKTDGRYRLFVVGYSVSRWQGGLN